MIDTFTANGTGWVPTLVVSEKMLTTGVHDGVADGSFDPSDADRLRPLRQAAELAVHMHRVGGLVGTGPDFPVDGLVAGESLHRELELLVEFGGATPLEALQMATSGAARLLGSEDLLGRVEADMLAEQVVLAANPLEEISNVRRVELVVHQGRRHRP